MKKDSLQEGIRGLRTVRLTDADRRVVFARLMEHVGQHPAMLRSPWKLYVSQYRFAYALASMVLILVTGGVTASAAGHSLPGDTLYPIKISVLEPLRGSLIRGAVPAANWAEEKTIRRLEEAETLAARGKLNVATVQMLKEGFAKSANEFTGLVQKPTAASSTAFVEARIDFGAKMSAHSQILASLASSSSQSEQEDMAPLVRLVDEHARSSKDDREQAVQVLMQATGGSAATSAELTDGRKGGREGDSRTQSQYAQSLFTSRAESILSLIHTTEDRFRDSLDATATTSMTAQSVMILGAVPQTLQSAKEALQDAEQKQLSGSSSEALSALIDSESAAKQADIWVKQSKRLSQEQKKSERARARSSGDNQDKRD